MFEDYLKDYRELFNMDVIAKYHLTNISDSFFTEGKIPEIDEVQKKIETARDSMSELSLKLSYYFDVTLFFNLHVVYFFSFILPCHTFCL